MNTTLETVANHVLDLLTNTDTMPEIDGLNPVVITDTPTGQVATFTGTKFLMEPNDGNGATVEYTFTITKKIHY